MRADDDNYDDSSDSWSVEMRYGRNQGGAMSDTHYALDNENMIAGAESRSWSQPLVMMTGSHVAPDNSNIPTNEEIGSMNEEDTYFPDESLPPLPSDEIVPVNGEYLHLPDGSLLHVSHRLSV